MVLKEKSSPLNRVVMEIVDRQDQPVQGDYLETLDAMVNRV